MTQDNTPPTTISVDQVGSVIEEEFNAFLDQTGRNTDEATGVMKAFLKEIAPEIEAALTAGDLMTLGYLRDATASRAGRTSLGLVYKERQVVASIVTTAVRTVLKLAIGVALA